MILDEAIKHAEEVAEEKEKEAWEAQLQEEYKTIKSCKECAKEHRQLAEWLKELKQLREHTRWIPCSKRLPEEDGQYLITVKYKPEADYENIYAEHGEWHDGRWDMFCFGHCGEVEDIVAWMPLPEPYEPQESEEKPKSECEHDHEILKAYSDGANAVLDNVRAEIEQAYCKVTNDYDHGRNYGLYMAIQIIDKYIIENEV